MRLTARLTTRSFSTKRAPFAWSTAASSREARARQSRLAQSLPTLVNLAEQQSKLLAAWLTGDYGLPDADAMRRMIGEDEARHQGHYYASRRHTMQVDFDVYKREIAHELKAGQSRRKHWPAASTAAAA